MLKTSSIIRNSFKLNINMKIGKTSTFSIYLSDYSLKLLWPLFKTTQNFLIWRQWCCKEKYLYVCWALKATLSCQLLSALKLMLWNLFIRPGYMFLVNKGIKNKSSLFKFGWWLVKMCISTLYILKNRNHVWATK